ncbi:MAG: response regulator [Erythrobacter sp.]|nr:response regulator [Erythrobacter sp.]
MPNAAAVAFLLRARFKNELPFLAAVPPSSLAAYALSGEPVSSAAVFALANLASVLIVLSLTRRLVGHAPDMSSLQDLARFVWIGGLAGPLASTAIASAAMMPIGASPASFGDASHWFLSESLGMITLVPAALLLAEKMSSRRDRAGRSISEGAILLGCSLLCAVLIFSQSAYPLLFLILPMTLIHAVRLGVLGTALHIAGVAVVAAAMTWAESGPIYGASASPAVRIHLIYAFLVANALTGLFVAAVLAGRDRLTNALDTRRRELAVLANSRTDAVLKIDRDGMCTYASPAVREVLGEETARFVGRPIEALTQEDASHRIADVLSRLLSGYSEKERITYRRQLDDAEGSPVFIEADCAVALDADTGLKEGVIISARDVTERVELELLLTRARRHAEKAAGAKSDFLANMSHEIRTPMNGVLGFAELMLQGELDPEQRHHAEMIVESGRSMMLLLNDILDLSKIEAGQIVIDTGPIDLHATLDECVALHRQAAKKKGLTLLLEYELDAGAGKLRSPPATDASCDDLLPIVITDGLRLRQITLNMIGNAVKFTESGEVRVSYWTHENELFVRVRDSGIGISASRLEKIFRPFTQGDTQTGRRYGGTGLGLSISRQLAELLGGRIAVESVPGAGSTFTLTLPATLVQADECAPDLAAAPVPEDLPQHSRILLVEDHDVNRMLVTEMLERCGQSVAVAQDGNEAISMVIDSVMRDRPFDLVLMDVQMPDCDGYEATRAIREEGIGPEALPIIALTANAFPEDVAAAREAGMQAHLAKPIVFDDLARVLGRWLPTRIVETPMDRDVAFEGEDDERTIEGDAAAVSAREKLHISWISRRTETIEAVRKGLANGLIANAKKRRAQDKLDREELVRLVHKLAGTAAAFGEPELGEAAAELEHAMVTNEAAEPCEALAFELLALADEPAPAT